jgi:hypothetical protein
MANIKGTRFDDRITGGGHAALRAEVGESGAIPLGRTEQSRAHAPRAEFRHPVVRRKC